ncbi:hypothetical protein ALC60_10423 [Trachymyrmex zeteki]|uniref:Uncharacterized protein n=1 Tax=Mycetomoellerius zeteki TaxID=64791 RepID=A0A151WRT7_9HYME|nr:hypothetical protein ALC60_10423 [Trachymyrmex zeteki]
MSGGAGVHRRAHTYGCRATCDAVTSANRPLLTPPRPFLTLRHSLSPFAPFRAAHEPHPRDRTRPPNYGLEFELAVNPFIALPPPPARQPPDRLTATLGSPPAPRHYASCHAVTFIFLASIRIRDRRVTAQRIQEESRECRARTRVAFTLLRSLSTATSRGNFLARALPGADGIRRSTPPLLYDQESVQPASQPASQPAPLPRHGILICKYSSHERRFFYIRHDDVARTDLEAIERTIVCQRCIGTCPAGHGVERGGWNGPRKHGEGGNTPAERGLTRRGETGGAVGRWRVTTAFCTRPRPHSCRYFPPVDGQLLTRVLHPTTGTPCYGVSADRTSSSSKPRSFDSSPMLDFDDRNFLSNTSTLHPDLETVKYFVKKTIYIAI